VSVPITSPANPRIKDLVRLRTRRHRDRTGRFLIEGFRELRRALDAAIDLEVLFVCPPLFLGDNEPDLVARAAAAGAELVEVTPEPFRKASYRDRPEGLLGVARRFDTSLDVLALGDATDPLLLVAEAIEKPGNLGTMLRSAAAAGAAGVMVTDPTTDPFNPNVIRASLGLVFTVPLALTTTESAIEHLRAHGLAVVATTPEGAQAHYAVDLTGPAAIVVGSEQYGLSAAWLDAADLRVAIPMPGPADSLNAATAAAIVLFEAVRQRRGPSGRRSP
jgi:RNA methyltransferase, TrmH family